MQTLLRRVSAWFRRHRLDHDVAEEIQLHLELRRQALIDDGMAPAEADREARRQFGNVTVIRERTRAEWVSPAAAALVQDVRFGARVLTHNPGLSLVVVLTIALGAGVNAALFLLLNNMLLRTPDIPGADRVVWLDDGKPLLGPTYPDYVDYRDRTDAFADLAAYAMWEVAARIDGVEQPISLRAVLASGNYFAVLRAQPAIGRPLGPADDRPPLGTPSVVLSDAMWTRRFNRDPGVLGRTIEINFKPFIIVGVMPRSFTGARAPNGNPFVPDVWLPLWCVPSLEPGATRLVQRTAWWGLQSIGRLRDDVSIAQARTQVSAVAAALDREYPGQRWTRAPWVSAVTAIDPRVLRSEPGKVIGLLSVVSLFVLVIACANVAGLLLARAAARRRETAVRLSLGASRGRIVRQFLAEGLLLASAGTLVGYVAASLVLQAVVSSGGRHELAWSFVPDTRMLIFSAVIVLAATVSTGLMPALQASKTALLPALTRAEGVRIGRLRFVLVGVEVAVSLVLVLATALLLRGVIRAHAIDPALPVDRLLAVEIDARAHGYQGAELDATLKGARRALEAVPGVVSTSMMSPAPFSGSRSGTTLRLAEAPDSPGLRLFLADVSGTFLETSGMELMRGRWFDERAPEEIVINQTMASRLWPAADPLGARVMSRDFERRSHVVVGIVRDTPYVSLRQQADPFMFRPGTGGTILVRTAGPAATAARSVAEAVKRLDSRFLVSARPLADGVATELDEGRMMIGVAAGIGFLALLVALAGIGATAAQSVAQRTHEIGVRMALGAQRRDAITFIVRRALMPVAIGSIAGLAVASQASRVLSAQLYGVSPLDPVAFLGGVAFVMAAAATAAWLPARRAATIDPVRALRSE
jgi:putative ABC transport system permease protein